MKTLRQTDRLSASQINSFAPSVNKYTLMTGTGTTIPIVYGRALVSGNVIAHCQQAGTPNYLTIAVAWCLGEIDQVRKVWINDEQPADGVKMRHYRGTKWQGVDPWLSTYMPGTYTDDLVMSFPNRDIGVAYTVFRIPDTAYDNIPTFKATIIGQLCRDPRDDVYNDHVLPHCNETVFAFDFDEQEPDFSINGNDMTLNGNVAVSAPYLSLPGSSGDYAEIAYDASMIPSAANWTFECKFRTSSVAVGTLRRHLIHIGDQGSNNYQMLISRDASSGGTGTQLDWSISSSAGATLASGAFTTSLAINTLYDIKLERIHNRIYAYFQGVVVSVSDIDEADIVKQNSLPWTIGAHGNHNAGTEWQGDIRSMRFTVGTFRYGCEHTSIYDNVPFSDFLKHKQWATGNSLNPAVCWGDLVRNDVYGLGFYEDLPSVIRAADWCDELALASGTVKRSQCNLVFDSPRPVTDYLDMLAEQANSIWYYDGWFAYIKSDQPYTTGINASGRELLNEGSEPDSTYWTYNSSYWTYISSKSLRPIHIGLPEDEKSPIPPIGYLQGTNITSNRTVTQNITTVAGVVYGVSLDVLNLDTLDYSAPGSTGTIAVKVGSTTVIAATASTGALYGTYTGAGGTETVTITATSGFKNGIDNISMRPLTWDYTDWIANSLTIQGLSDSDSPTRVTIRWQGFDINSANWPEMSTSAELTGVSTGAVPLRQTVVYMPSVLFEAEAQDRADARLARTNNKTRVSVVVPDSGVAHLPGDVIRLTSTARGVDLYMKVSEVELVEPGRYRITGMKYSADHYPN